MSKDPAISYIRFSDPVQSTGDSEDRQDQDYAAFCERHRLEPIKEYRFIDRGLSGWTEEHRRKGDMGRLEAAAKAGVFPKRAVLVVEAWDRFCRMRPEKATAFLADLLRTGLRLGICHLDDIFSEEDFGTHKWVTLSVFIQLAFQESEQKSKRIARSWQRRRRLAREQGTLPAWACPAWVDSSGDQPRLIPERAAVVRRIFALSAIGYGDSRIVQTFTRENVQPFGEPQVKPGRKRSQFSGCWTRTYIRAIIRDRRALGEFQPRTKDRQVDGEAVVIPSLAVVTEEEFALARTGRQRRSGTDKVGRPTGPRQRKYLNLFSGLLKNAADGQGWSLAVATGLKVRYLVLVNASGADGRSKRTTMPYPVFESAFVRLFRELSPADIAPPVSGPNRVTVLKARRDAVAEDIAGYKGDLRRRRSAHLVELLHAKEDEYASIEEELAIELARAAHPLSAAWDDCRNLMDALASAPDQEDARIRFNAALRRTVESIWLLVVPHGRDRFCAVQVWFAGYKRHRDYIIFNRAASNHRQGGWWAKSRVFAGRKAGAGQLDLRRREDAEELQAELRTIDLSAIFPEACE